MTTNKSIAASFAHMDSASAQAALCPDGFLVAPAIDIDQDWDVGATTVMFSDGSALVISGPSVDVRDARLAEAE